MNSFEFKHPRIWDNKETEKFKMWLEKEIASGSDKWSQEFEEYIKIKWDSSKIHHEETSAEKQEENTFNRYIISLDIPRQSLQDKRIMDLGCDEGEFVTSCINKNITQEAYGLDTDLDMDSLENQHKNNFFIGDFTKDLPVKNLDYIISVGAISLFFDKEYGSKAENAIKKSIEAIKDSGEIRIWPIKKALRGDELQGIEEEEMVVNDIINHLEKEFDVVCELKTTDIGVSGKDKDIWAEQVLIIKRKNL
ncbi:MAG: hypothetical protein HGB12_17185 [Bacteroidetes bacterium]|nr:hypothetical protein [Bacteroidota bacterium]